MDKSKAKMSVILCILLSEDVLPRSSYVSAILKNVGALYHGCMVQPHSLPASNPEHNASNFVHFEDERRPTKGK